MCETIIIIDGHKTNYFKKYVINPCSLNHTRPFVDASIQFACRTSHQVFWCSFSFHLHSIALKICDHICEITHTTHNKEEKQKRTNDSNSLPCARRNSVLWCVRYRYTERERVANGAENYYFIASVWGRIKMLWTGWWTWLNWIAKLSVLYFRSGCINRMLLRIIKHSLRMFVNTHRTQHTTTICAKYVIVWFWGEKGLIPFGKLLISWSTFVLLWFDGITCWWKCC